MAKFCRYQLGTTDVAAAREFYSVILGHDRALIASLPQQALACAAKPHWLGSLGVEDPALLTEQFIARCDAARAHALCP